MNKLLRLIGISFILVSLLSTGLLYVTSVNYVNYTETATKIPRNIAITDVRIPLILDESQDHNVQVYFTIHNPSKLTIYVTSIESYLYMDDLSDLRSWPEKQLDLMVGVGQFTLLKDQAYLVHPGETISIPTNMTVGGGSDFMSILNTTYLGKYYPYVYGTVRYTFEYIDLIEIVRGVFFSGANGIDPI
jgi:hypothetical protein